MRNSPTFVILLSHWIQVLLRQVRQDEDIRDLAEGLQQTLSFANQCPDLLHVNGATNIIEEIGRSILDASSLIDEYAKYPFAGMSFEVTHKPILGPCADSTCF